MRSGPSTVASTICFTGLPSCATSCLTRTAKTKDTCTQSLYVPSLQDALEERQEQVVEIVGRLVVHGPAGDAAPWLSARLLSHFVAHGKRVEAAIKGVARWGCRKFVEGFVTVWTSQWAFCTRQLLSCLFERTNPSSAGPGLSSKSIDDTPGPLNDMCCHAMQAAEEDGRCGTAGYICGRAASRL